VKAVTSQTVSNAYGPGERHADELLDQRTELGIGFLSSFSLLTSGCAEPSKRSPCN